MTVGREPMKLREKKLQRVVYVESFLIEIFQRERERLYLKKRQTNEAKVYRREKNTQLRNEKWLV